MPVEKAVPLSALPSVWMRVVMKWCQLLRQMILKKHIIICGGSGIIFQRTDTWQFLLVERVEGFATEEEWKRAYQEINDMEAHLVKSGTIVLKFWMHIDKDEQEKRFKQRMETPEKQWKITDEDWRNRDKWDDYEKAVDEMMLRTSTTEAPWHIIEANSKLYARIKVLEIVVEALEKRLE